MVPVSLSSLFRLRKGQSLWRQQSRDEPKNVWHEKTHLHFRVLFVRRPLHSISGHVMIDCLFSFGLLGAIVFKPLVRKNTRNQDGTRPASVFPSVRWSSTHIVGWIFSFEIGRNIPHKPCGAIFRPLPYKGWRVFPERYFCQWLGTHGLSSYIGFDSLLKVSDKWLLGKDGAGVFLQC